MDLKEENCIVLDFLPNGYPDRRHPEPIAQTMGTKFFTLLELIPKEDIQLSQGEEVYIGEDKRDKIRFIRGQMEYKSLTNIAKNNIEDYVEDLIIKNEENIIKFLNKAGIVTPRLHSLDLIPGIGKKMRDAIIAKRSEKNFESLKDFESRIPTSAGIVKIISRRVISEITEDQKYNLFVQKRKKNEFH